MCGGKPVVRKSIPRLYMCHHESSLSSLNLLYATLSPTPLTYRPTLTPTHHPYTLTHQDQTHKIRQRLKSIEIKLKFCLLSVASVHISYINETLISRISISVCLSVHR